MDCLSVTRGLWPRKFWSGALVAAAILWGAGTALAQTPATAGTRAGRVAVEQQEKARDLKPYAPNKAEVLLAKVEEQFITGALHWHPFFQSALAGGGFTLGAAGHEVIQRALGGVDGDGEGDAHIDAVSGGVL